MNRYGRMAHDHWRRYLPIRFATIRDPATYFRDLGDQVAMQVTNLESRMAGEAPAGETYQERLGRLTNARQRAEEVTLRELVLLAPEPSDQATRPALEGPATEPSSDEGWHPVIEDPRDPFWASQPR